MGFRSGMHQSTLRTDFLRRGEVVLNDPFHVVRIASTGATVSALVVTPPGTPPHEGSSPDRGEAERRADRLLPAPLRRASSRSAPARTLIGDARDLLVHAVHESTGVTLACVNVGAPELNEAPASRNIIHIGMSPLVRALLTNAWAQVNAEFRDAPGVERGDPRAGFDGDGFIHVELNVFGQRHLIILGGSDYGTYYGVATLLARDLGARWVFPGPDGEVIPRRAGGWSVGGGLNLYEEPDFRGRSLELLAGGLRTALPEVDGTRTWALNNRLNPTDERVYIWENQGMSVPIPQCAVPDLRFARATFGKENRIPADHSLHNLLSPWEPPLTDPLARIGDSHPEFFPDVRPRISTNGDRPSVTGPGLAPLGADLDAAMGVPLAASALDFTWSLPSQLRGVNGLVQDRTECRPDALPAGSLFDDWVPGVPRPPAPNPEMLGGVAIRATAGLAAQTSEAANRFGYSATSDAGMSAFYRAHFAFIAPVGDILRFLPWTYRSTIHAAHQPDPNAWKPCVYGLASGVRAGSVPSPNADLVAFLTTRVNREAVAITASSPRDEVCVSVAPNDGAGGWCQCAPCSLSGTSSANIAGGNLGGPDSTQFRMLAGRPLFRQTPNDPALPPGSPRREATEQSAVVAPQNRRWLSSLPAPSTDVAAARGFFSTWCCPDSASRRVVDLTRALSRAAWSASWPEMYLTTHAYSAGRGAPMTADITEYLLPPRYPDGVPELAYDRGYSRSISEYAGDQVLVYITSTADVREYQREPEPRATLAMLQNRFPRSFNVLRWSVITRQHGMYEYLYGAYVYMTPRLYSKSLHTALRRGHARRARAFNAETQPIWGLEGPKWFEVASMLWDVARTPDSLRAEWATAVTGRDDGEANDEAARLLVEIYSDLEARWLRAVAAAEEQNGALRSDEIYQPRLVGAHAPAQLDALDDFAPGARVLSRPLGGHCDVVEKLRRVAASARAGGSPFSKASRRIDFLLGGLEPCAALTEASRPIRLLHRWIDAPPADARISSLPRRGEPAFDGFLEALRIVDGWVADPAQYLSAVHGAFQASPSRHGLIEPGASPRSVRVRSAGASAFATHWIAQDLASLLDYCDHWNSAVAEADDFLASRFVADNARPIRAMFIAIKGWVLEFRLRLIDYLTPPRQFENPEINDASVRLRDPVLLAAFDQGT